MSDSGLYGDSVDPANLDLFHSHLGTDNLSLEGMEALIEQYESRHSIAMKKNERIDKQIEEIKLKIRAVHEETGRMTPHGAVTAERNLISVTEKQVKMKRALLTRLRSLRDKSSMEVQAMKQKINEYRLEVVDQNRTFDNMVQELEETKAALVENYQRANELVIERDSYIEETKRIELEEQREKAEYDALMKSLANKFHYLQAEVMETMKEQSENRTKETEEKNSVSDPNEPGSGELTAEQEEEARASIVTLDNSIREIEGIISDLHLQTNQLRELFRMMLLQSGIPDLDGLVSRFQAEESHMYEIFGFISHINSEAKQFEIKYRDIQNRQRTLLRDLAASARESAAGTLRLLRELAHVRSSLLVTQKMKARMGAVLRRFSANLLVLSGAVGHGDRERRHALEGLGVGAAAVYPRTLQNDENLRIYIPPAHPSLFGSFHVNGGHTGAAAGNGHSSAFVQDSTLEHGRSAFGENGFMSFIHNAKKGAFFDITRSDPAPTRGTHAARLGEDEDEDDPLSSAYTAPLLTQNELNVLLADIEAGADALVQLFASFLRLPFGRSLLQLGAQDACAAIEETRRRVASGAFRTSRARAHPDKSKTHSENSKSTGLPTHEADLFFEEDELSSSLEVPFPEIDAAESENRKVSSPSARSLDSLDDDVRNDNIVHGDVEHQNAESMKPSSCLPSRDSPILKYLDTIRDDVSRLADAIDTLDAQDVLPKQSSSGPGDAQSISSPTSNVGEMVDSDPTEVVSQLGVTAAPAIEITSPRVLAARAVSANGYAALSHLIRNLSSKAGTSAEVSLSNTSRSNRSFPALTDRPRTALAGSRSKLHSSKHHPNPSTYTQAREDVAVDIPGYRSRISLHSRSQRPHASEPAAVEKVPSFLQSGFAQSMDALAQEVARSGANPLMHNVPQAEPSSSKRREDRTQLYMHVHSSQRNSGFSSPLKNGNRAQSATSRSRTRAHFDAPKNVELPVVFSSDALREIIREQHLQTGKTVSEVILDSLQNY